jgi:hypothetical protein
MVLLVGLLSGLVGAAAGGLASFFTSRSQLRLDLEFAYDRELRTQRMAAYRSLYARTEKLPRYWRDPPGAGSCRRGARASTSGTSPSPAGSSCPTWPGSRTTTSSR